MHIQITNLNLNYDNKIIFKNAELDIDFDRLYICGKNGTGKTSLLKCISKKQRYKGTITFFPKQKKRTIVGQHNILLEDLNVSDNVLLLNSRCKKIIFEEFFNEYPMVNKKHKIKKLSGGQKQLLNFLIAFYIKSDILLVDEPLNNLDKNKVTFIKEKLINDDRPQIIVSHFELGLEGKKIHIEDCKLKNE